MSTATPKSLRTALESVITRLEEVMETDCECDNTHEANHTVCALCQYREALAHDEECKDAYLVVVEDAKRDIVWGNAYPLSRFPTDEAAKAQCLSDCATQLGRQQADGRPDTTDLSVIYVAHGDIRIDTIFTDLSAPPYR